MNIVPRDRLADARRLTPQKVLLVAYHFPPIQGSTGTMRTIAFSRYLRQYGWDVRVLTVNPNAYEATESANQTLVADHVKVERAWAIDARRHLAFRGRYLRILALPDRWQSWIFGGFIKGVGLVKSWKPDVIMSTYPIASAHALAFFLHRRFRLPWVAEFRDPMLQASFPHNKWERIAFDKIEKATLLHADQVIVTTEGCKTFYLNKFPQADPNNFSVISNGYDPAVFANVERLQNRSDRIVLLHSGLLYPHERNPTDFFKAVQSLRNEGFFEAMQIEFRFRGSGNEDGYVRLIRELGIQPLISLLPTLPYEKALEEVFCADALMLFQGSSCNDQVPAKVYEYFYSRKPIVAFTDEGGDTAILLRSVGIDSIASLQDEEQIKKVLKKFLGSVKQGTAFTLCEQDVKQFSRETLTASLDRVLSLAADRRQ